VMQTPRLAVR